jgi:acyl carrier protein
MNRRDGCDANLSGSGSVVGSVRPEFRQTMSRPKPARRRGQLLSAEVLTLDELSDIIREVQPSLQGISLTPDQSVVDDLGLDSLDLLQLSRRIMRDKGLDLDLDEWNSTAAQHHHSIGSILDALAPAAT